MGSHSALSAEIKKHVSIPVATVGRITEPWLAEELLENDKADICMIGRANLCEPEFCNKAQAGHEEDIRPCIGCLRCLNGIMFGKRVACTVNPSLEPENEDTITPAKETKMSLLSVEVLPEWKLLTLLQNADIMLYLQTVRIPLAEPFGSLPFRLQTGSDTADQISGTQTGTGRRKGSFKYGGYTGNNPEGLSRL